jgi:hypothetical protein
MIHKKIRPEPLGAPFRGKMAEPDNPSVMLVKALGHEKPEIRLAAVRGLSAICMAHIAEPTDVAISLLRLFEFHARYSPHNDMREECIDALAGCRDTHRLRSLTFEIGSDGTKEYRDEVLRRLEHEIC